LTLKILIPWQSFLKHKYRFYQGFKSYKYPAATFHKEYHPIWYPELFKLRTGLKPWSLLTYFFDTRPTLELALLKFTNILQQIIDHGRDRHRQHVWWEDTAFKFYSRTRLWRIATLVKTGQGCYCRGGGNERAKICVGKRLHGGKQHEKLAERAGVSSFGPHPVNACKVVPVCPACTCNCGRAPPAVPDSLNCHQVGSGR
jgi:hypothetical protein